MSFKNNIICEEFSKEVWKYLDGTLSNEEKAFWKRHLDSCSACRASLNEIEKSLDIYDSLPLEDISDEKFNAIIVKATEFSGSRGFSRFLGFMSKYQIKKSFAFSKTALGTAALAASVIVMFIIYMPKTELKTMQGSPNIPKQETEIYNDSGNNKTNENLAEDRTAFENKSEIAIRVPSVKTRHEVMEWKAEVVRNKINDVGYSLDQINQSEQIRLKYSDKWSMKTAIIDYEIERLKKEINDSSL